MAFKPITVNTPPEAPAHILAEDDSAIYGGIIGGDCVLDIGSKMNASVITNNKVRIQDGVVLVGGHAGRLVKGDYEDMVIENGVSGQKRNDIIVARFVTTGAGGLDTYKLVVIKGASGATASDPVVIKGDLYAGDKQRDYPLWRVRLEGLSIVKVEQMYEVAPTLYELENNVADVFTPYNTPIFANKDMYSNGLSYWRKVGKTVTFHFSVQGVGTGGYKMITGLPGAVGSAIFPFMTVYGVGNGALIIDTSGTGSLSEVKLNVNSVVSGSYICN